MTNKYTSMGKGGSNLNCAAYTAGIIEGILNSAKMYSKVSAHLYGEGEDHENPGQVEDITSTTIYVIKFSKEVTARDKT